MPQFIKRFLEWISLKEKIDTSKAKAPKFKEGEIWMIHFGENVGFESSGRHAQFHRPVIILHKFNSHLFYGLPTSTKLKPNNPFYTEFIFKNKPQSAMISQVRSLSSKRLHYKLGELPNSDISNLRKEFLSLFDKK